jgi:hypothetical protein
MTKLKLNLGCGFKKIDGFVGVDAESACKPDMIYDIEQTPWPWADNSVDEIYLIHVMEHLGRTSSQYILIIQELFRICDNNARIIIEVPHHRNDNFHSDPTHVRPITILGLQMFDQNLNQNWINRGLPVTPLGLYHHVNFQIKNYHYTLDPYIQAAKDRGDISEIEVADLINTRSNIAIDLKVEWCVVKDK